MKNKKTLFIFLMGLLLLVGACSSKGIEPKEAASIFLDAEFYGKATEKYEKYFNVKIVDVEKSIKEGLALTMKPLGVSDETLDTMSKNIKETIAKKTSYKIKEVETKKETTTVTAEIYGLDFTNLETEVEEKVSAELIKVLKENGIEINSIEEISEITDPTQIEKGQKIVQDPEMTAKIMNTILPSLFKETEKMSKPTDVAFVIKESKKEGWEVADYNNIVLDLTDAFLNL